MEYTIILSTNSTLDLMSQVNEHIKKGWKPQGGVSVVSHVFLAIDHNPMIAYLQAMVKEN